MASTIKTAIRVRPFLETESEQGYRNTRLQVNQEKREIIVREDGNVTKKNYKFDYLFGQEASQSDVYAQCGVDEMIAKALEGYHSTIFAYGQTGSGKTYTMQGQQSSTESVQLSGLIPRVARSLYQKMSKFKSQRSYTVSISFLQIYSEKIYDLLNPASLNNRTLNMNTPNIQGLRLRWNKDQQFTVQNLFLFQCKNEAELMRHFSNGLKNRINATHKLNVQSSRSHSIFSLRIESFEHSNPSHIRVSRIELVDLAGSQRLSLTGTEGKLAKQSIDINKSLFTLRQVINILSENGNPKNKKQDKVYVPYRDSKLTSILKQSIGGNSYCLMIACINPNDPFFEENISTLTYATKASYITNCPVINDDPKVKAINELKKQVKQLTSELDKANRHIEFLSSLNQTKQKFQGQSRVVSPQKQLKSTRKEVNNQQSSLPQPIFKKKLNQKINAVYDGNISERLIESINMVRELLKSNKQLRQKLQIANHYIDEKDIEIFEISRENELLREGTTRDTQSPPHTKPSTNQSKRLSLKVHNSLVRQPPLNDYLPPESSSGNRIGLPTGISLDMNQLYLNEKGIDSAPTNFNKRLSNTSQEKRVGYSRGNSSSHEDRHAITAKFSKRGWLSREGQGRKFLSFYQDLKGEQLS